MKRGVEVEFLAHAGVRLSDSRHTIFIDPWFTSSSIAQPILESICPGHRTIDFQIPASRVNPSTLKADLILVSHYHTHHSPRQDIQGLLANNLHASVAGPMEDVATTMGLINNLIVNGRSHKFLPCSEDSELKLGHFRVIPFSHTHEGHFGYLILHPFGVFVHLVDARLHRSYDRNSIDKCYGFLENLQPDLFLISAAGHTTRMFSKKKRVIVPATFRPSEAAQLVAFSGAKKAGLIGIQNHSMYRNRTEFSMPGSLLEDEFVWAMEWLHPEAEVVKLLPSMKFKFEAPRKKQKLKFKRAVQVLR